MHGKFHIIDWVKTAMMKGFMGEGIRVFCTKVRLKKKAKRKRRTIILCF